MKELIVALSAGFCFGVSRSVEMAEELLEENGKCKCLGELIHNEDVVERLTQKGMTVISKPEEAQSGDNVIIRAHGVSKAVYDELEGTGAIITDATCPKVKAIHKIVSRAAEEGDCVFVIGMKNHPEVEAICGWCKECYVFENPAELEEWIENNQLIWTKPITVVVQTTQTRSNFNECCNIIKKRCTNAKISDTICTATFTRQEEAQSIASQCDCMVVIGGKHSANSIHLAQICREKCENVQFIERLDELDVSALNAFDTVGLTAGTSTPAWIIKEVRNKMDEMKVNTTAEETKELSFDEMLEETLKTIYNGDKVTGLVVAITGTEISVDLGTKYSGFIPTSEFTDDGIKVEDAVKVGDTVEAVVVRVNDVEGTAMLSKKRLDAAKSWNAVEEAVESEAVMEGVVTEENKGGLVVTVKGVRVFVPASQSGQPRGAELSGMLKEKVSLRITEVNRARRRVVGSIRSVTQEARMAAQAALWESIEEGKRYTGTVKSMTSYGVFVDIGGVDGMVHISELSWSRIKTPAEVVSVGDALDVYVISVDKEKHKISLGVKDRAANPWDVFMGKYKVGDVASVRVVKLMTFGAFAEVVPGVDGLIHISQLADHRVEKVADVVSEGQIVDAKITAVDEENKKISLSIRALTAPEAPVAEEEASAEEAAPAEEAPAEEN